jgi:peptide/nickel transport system substrate-binding protein
VVDIKINPNAVWDDGQPITSADYIFTLDAQRSLDPHKGGCAALQTAAGYSQIESHNVISDKEFTFTFIRGQAFADWRGFFSGASGSAPLLSKHVFDKGSPKDNCDYMTRGWPVADGVPLGASNGLWLAKKSNINVGSSTVTLVPNPLYWGVKPKLNRIVYRSISADTDTLVQALRNGTVDMAYPLPEPNLVNKLSKLVGVTTSINFGPEFEHLDFNTRNPLLGIKEVRQAIAYGIDRPSLAKATVAQFSDKASVLGNRLLVPTQPGYVNNGVAFDKQDTAKATSLLEGIGARKGADGVYVLKGKPLKFAITTPPQTPLLNTTIAVIKQQLQSLGIAITENATDDIFKDGTHPQSLVAGGFDIALFPWGVGPSLSANNSIYQSVEAQGGTQGHNYSRGVDSEVDTVLTQMAQAPTPAEEVEFANKADKLLWEDMFTLPLFQMPTVLSFENKFAGIGDNATAAGPLWNNDMFAVK